MFFCGLFMFLQLDCWNIFVKFKKDIPVEFKKTFWVGEVNHTFYLKLRNF